MKGSYQNLEAMVTGWRIRRILKTKEIDMRVRQIKEFELELRLPDLEANMIQGLIMSRNNTVSKMVALIDKMQSKGLWLTYKRLESKPKPKC
jgi:hypothetical protein